MYTVVNPATGQTIQSFEDMSDSEVDDALRRAAGAFPLWRDTAVAERCAALGRVADAMMAQQEELAKLITVEMGKPISSALGEVATAAEIIRFYAENAERHLKPEPLGQLGGSTAFVERHPVGVILGIMPWNFPYYQVARFAGPVLAAGNTLLLKHAPQCPTSALALARIFAEELPVRDAYVNIFATNAQIAHLIPRPEIQGVSLTGSERAGAAVAQIAGGALKKVVLELGGSDPFIVLDDHDLVNVAATAVAGRLSNTGQACAAPKRFIVLDSVFERFSELFTRGMEAVKPGDPTNAETIVGPLVSESAVERLDAQIEDARAKGATILTGGHRTSEVGAFYAPTVITDVTPDMRVYSEELFGPAAVLYRVKDDAEAVLLANDSPFGLGSTVYAADENRAAAVAAQLEVGMVVVNGRRPHAPALPFGGVKRSGFGRELGTYGMEEFVNHKVIAVLPVASQ